MTIILTEDIDVLPEYQDVKQDEFMLKRKDVLTTGQVAQICNVAPRTVTKWFDSGQLHGYRIPGSRDRRIPVSELIRFMKAHNIPTESLKKGHIRILIIDSNEENYTLLSNSLTSKGPFDISFAQNSFDAGLLAQKVVPNLVLLNLMSPDIDAHTLCNHIRQSDELKESRVIAIAAGLGQNESQTLLKKGYDAVITDTTNINHVLQVIHQTYSIM